MKVSITPFAVLTEYLKEVVSIEIPAQTKVSELLHSLANMYPNASAILQECRVARNNEILSLDALISDGDELLIFPPSSGG